MDWLTCAKNFVLIVELGSFAAVARKRYMSASALSKQISWLEDELDSRLFHRTTRKLHLTHEGEAYYHRVKAIIADIDDAKGCVRGKQDELVGELSFSLPPSYDRSKMMDLIFTFMALHPKLEIKLLFTNQVVDLIQSGIDIAYRSYPVEGESYGHVVVISLKCHVYASPEYLKTYGTPKTLADLAQHNCLAFDDSHMRLWRFANGLTYRPKGNFICNSIQALREAALRGLGLVYLVERHADDLVAAGKLVTVLDNYQPSPFPMYLNYIQQGHVPRKVQALIDFIQDYVAKKHAQTTH